MLCALCKQVSYCSAACQKRDWKHGTKAKHLITPLPKHKLQCKLIQREVALFDLMCLTFERRLHAMTMASIIAGLDTRLAECIIVLDFVTERCGEYPTGEFMLTKDFLATHPERSAFSREFSMRALDMIQENLELDATHISVVAIQNGPTPDGPNDVLVRDFDRNYYKQSLPELELEKYKKSFKGFPKSTMNVVYQKLREGRTDDLAARTPEAKARMEHEFRQQFVAESMSDIKASGTPGIMETFAKNMMAKSDTRGDIPREMQLMRSALEALDTAESPLADSIRNMLKADESSPGNLDQAGETAAKSILGGGAAGQ